MRRISDPAAISELSSCWQSMASSCSRLLLTILFTIYSILNETNGRVALLLVRVRKTGSFRMLCSIFSSLCTIRSITVIIIVNSFGEWKLYLRIMNKRVSALLGSEASASSADILFNFANPNELLVPVKEGFRCKALRKFIHTTYYQIFIAIITLISLFIQDIHQIAFSPHENLAFNTIEIGIICVFVADSILNCIGTEGYLLSFYFWLDISTIFGMFADLRVIIELILCNGNIDYFDKQLSDYNSNAGIRSLLIQAKNIKTIMRVIKELRILRVLRILKLYRLAFRARKFKAKQILKPKSRIFGKKNVFQSSPVLDETPKSPDSVSIIQKQTRSPQYTQTTVQCKDPDQAQVPEQSQSKISQIISDKTLTKIISGIILISFFGPLFEVSNYQQPTKCVDFVVNNIDSVLNKKSINISLVVSALYSTIDLYSHSDEPLVYFGTPFNQLPRLEFNDSSSAKLEQLVIASRVIDVNRIMALHPQLSLNQGEQPTIVAVSSTDFAEDNQSYFSIGKIFYVVAVILLILRCFERNTDGLIVSPIEEMMERVRNVEKNPEAVKVSFDYQNQYETALVHNTLIKISGLLSTVYGNSGVRVITQSMFGHNNHSLSWGRKQCAIYGVCQIKDFTDACQVLHEDLLIFVNLIAEIVHSATYRYGGSACQNNGETLLLVWCIPQAQYVLNDEDNSVTWLNQRFIRILSDFSVFSFVKALVKLQKQPSILRYRKDQRLLQRLGARYMVGLRFGLHIGWAIQGAVGSDHKIDVSYIGPNVNLVKKMTSIAKQFNVPFVISRDIYQLLSSTVQQLCQPLGPIWLKGQEAALRFYSIDVDLNHISRPVDKIKKRKNILSEIDIVMKRQINLTFLQQDCTDYSASVFIQHKKQLRQALLNHKNDSEFKQSYTTGLRLFVEGRWSLSDRFFKAALIIRPSDGPTLYFLDYIKRNSWNSESPKSWKGHIVINS